MRAMILPALCRLDENPNPLRLAALPDPMPRPGEILVRVSACGMCQATGEPDAPAFDANA
jgi:D-arabinose 1-dehydrogenase-like Zn-dependent alcohol dehydrogenase